MATVTNLYIDQGSDFTAEIDLYTNNSTILDLSGANVYAQFRRSYSSATAYNFDASILDAANGKIKLAVAASLSSNIRYGRYLYDVELEQPTNDANVNTRTRVLEGILTIYPEITR